MFFDSRHAFRVTLPNESHKVTFALDAHPEILTEDFFAKSTYPVDELHQRIELRQVAGKRAVKLQLAVVHQRRQTLRLFALLPRGLSFLCRWGKAK